MSWHGTLPKISGGFTTSTTKRGVVIPFPVERIQATGEIVEWGSRHYRLRPGSWADHVWQWISVSVD